jgi:two-component system, LytTR family, sensor kinase
VWGVRGPVLVVLLLLLGGIAMGWWTLRARRLFTTAEQRAVYETLHQASLASPDLRAGLTAGAAQKSARHLRALLGTPAVAVCDEDRVLAWEGGGQRHAEDTPEHVAATLADGREHVLGPDRVACEDLECAVRHVVVAPLQIEDQTVGALAAYTNHVSPGLVRATSEVARWVSTQLELAELDASRTRLMEAEMASLRSQISPHFVYNALTAIASFVRTDPERARGLLLAFAEFTRYSLRHDAAFTTLAEELRAIDQYLELERARFGERLQVTLQIAPEVLPVAVPFLCVQPLVENAVRHGLEGRPGPGHIWLQAENRGAEAVISVEDDGIGMDPERARAVLSGDVPEAIGMHNVDARLRQAYGDGYGVVVETGDGLGTRVSVRLPKYHAGVHVS